MPQPVHVRARLFAGDPAAGGATGRRTMTTIPVTRTAVRQASSRSTAGGRDRAGHAPYYGTRLILDQNFATSITDGLCPQRPI